MTTRPSAIAPDFPRFWAASGTSLLGSGITTAALPLLAATLTADPVAVAAVAAAGRLPWLLFALHIGVLADRWDRKRAMWCSDLIRAALLAALGFAVLAGAASIPVLMVVGFLISIADTAFDSSGTAIMPKMVSGDRPRIERTNSWLVGTRTVVESFVGPPLGGLLFTASKALPFFGDAVSFVISAAFLGGMRGDYRVRRTTAPGTVRESLVEGLTWLWHRPVLRTITVIAGFYNVAALAQNAIFVLFAQREFALGAFGFSLLLATGAVGALLGAVCVPAINTACGAAVALRLSLLLSGVACLMTFVATTVWVVVAAEVLAGFATAVWNVNQLSLRQSGTPDHLMGRVTGIHRLVTYGGMPIGALLGGVLAAWIGLRASFVFAGGLFGVLTLVAAFTVTRGRVAALVARPALTD